ncbi:hypothetical protein G7Z17_g1382 [Cylindrodendrum hubeiense]|uniref:Flavin-containing monooxygenase n=1 Tax=Cylindrodendrum hubeiense TaxID=595255 RepID=A0A9P5HJT1_9HYPO|nr:hypothetical protein G7Z17_g1382 [Cylindrodendrum hubeiense]
MTANGSRSIPSHMRPVPGSVNIPIAKFPATAGPAKSSTERQAVVEGIIARFNEGLASRDPAVVSSLFSANGFWRDHLALSWDFRTVNGRQGIFDYLQSSFSAEKGSTLKTVALDTKAPICAPQSAFLDVDGQVPCLIFSFNIDTTTGAGMGMARLIQDSPGTWSIFTLYTALRQLHGHEETIFHRRPLGMQHGDVTRTKNWAETRKSEAEYEDEKSPDVLILGAGQAGLTIAARLKALGVNALMIDKCDRVGDNWRKRYHQLVLHDPVWVNHLPYVKFPPQWPIFTPKDKIADFFEAYVSLLELNVWTRTEIITSKWNPQGKDWTVTVKRRLENGVEETRTMSPRHIIQATGHSGKMTIPDIKGIKSFQGDRICHSSEFGGAQENDVSKRAVVVGCCNSAHDICHDFLEKGYHVTMVQRSTTCVISSKSSTERLKPLYAEGGPDVDDADLLFHSTPLSVLKAVQVGVTALQGEWDAGILRGLEEAGFKVDKGPDDTGLFIKYLQRGGGYYIDVGASQLIADGKIKLKQGQELEEILPRGLKFADGSELEADEIVFATGYDNMRTHTRQIFGDEVADLVGDVWGFNAEGELRTMWRRTGHPGFWFHGGNLALCRYYSRLLALQIKALEEGICT